MKQTPQDEIRSIMTKNGLSWAWLAEQLGTYYQKVQYAVETKKGLSSEEYGQIMSVFEKHGYLESSKDLSGSIAGLTIKTNSTINKVMKNLNDQVGHAIEDDKVTYEERVYLKQRLEDFRRSFNEEIDSLIKALEVKI